MQNSVPAEIRFSVDAARVQELFSVLQNGFLIKTQGGCTVKELLCERLLIDYTYVVERIGTIFLDGRPVDDIDAATVKQGSTLALSAAMPGLVGAVLRRGSPCSAFRSSITYRETDTACSGGEATVTVKLFNLPARELGPELLRRGILVRSADLDYFLETRGKDFFRGCKAIHLDGKAVGPDFMRQEEWSSRCAVTMLFATADN